MPPSQLKQLKASLRENGIIGPQKSKKQKKQGAKAESRANRDAALHGIREKFNPFDVKAATRPNKRDVTTLQNIRNGAKPETTIYGRPGVTKSHGEELRRKSLLLEVQKKYKVGGIVDKRIGEDDPNMTPDEKAQQRFAREQERKSRKHALFDLEMEEMEDEDTLTHGGRVLGSNQDDFDAGSLSGSSDVGSDNDSAGGLLKRKREAVEDILAAAEDLPERKKSKHEVMKEVIAKSKLYKYERQQAKEDDDLTREELDKGIGDLKAALFGLQNSLGKKQASDPTANGHATDSSGGINPDRVALMEARLDPEKDYDVQIKKLAQDQRSKVTDRTKTEEEKIVQASERKKVLEQSRVQRMHGEVTDEDDPSEPSLNGDGPDADGYRAGLDDAEAFGLPSTHVMEKPPGFDDEDDFVVDQDLVASGSDLDEDDSAEDSDEGDSIDEMLEDGGDDEEPGARNRSITGANQVAVSSTKISGCPATYEAVRNLLEDGAAVDASTVIRKVRLRYDASLSTSNKARLEDFATALVHYLAQRPDEQAPPPLQAFEAIIRHLQSMSRTFADQTGKAFREHLETMHKEQRMTTGDLMALTAIGTIFPTSDHFHQVVTPAMTLIARWLGLNKPTTPEDMAKGMYLTTLALKYVSFSKRYVPEAVRFTVAALAAKPDLATRQGTYKNIRTMSALWFEHSAFIEIITPLLPYLEDRKDAASRTLLTHLQALLTQSQAARKPLFLHDHRPLPIKSLIPKFEENFNPDRHYDPDRERADATRLKKEYKRERKGAVRELRKDANFLAREKLREKRERDRAYEEKYRRLVAEVQGEEGREAKEYEREKRRRKGKH